MQVLHHPQKIQFASDNYSGIHPAILTALATANGGHERAYGYDVYSERLSQVIKGLFGEQATCYPVFNGTGANVLALSAMLPRFGAVLCTKHAHIANDESNAPEYVAGVRPVLMSTTDGKLTPEKIAEHLSDSEHNAQIRAVYVSQTTELGTCYEFAELKAIGDECKRLGLYFFVDGARLANAMAYTGGRLSDLTEAGVDMLSFGGTKNGLMLGELLVVLNPALDVGIRHLRKSHLQLGSKMRFISAQFLAWFENDLWLSLASHSNQMAQYLAQELQSLQGVTLSQKVQSNAVFASFPPAILPTLSQEFGCYEWGEPNLLRLMTAFDTQKSDVDFLIERIKVLLNKELECVVH